MNGNGSSAPGQVVKPRPARCIQFGVFQLRTETGELLKHGIKVKLQGKPCQILQALLERPGSVVTREELRARLWNDDTVDFESSLNTAANRLRIALGDSADQPRYVETLPRVGYRFIAPVQETVATPVFSLVATPDNEVPPAIVEPPAAPAAPVDSAPTPPASSAPSSIPVHPARNSRNAVLAMLAAGIVAGAIFVSLRKPQRAAPTLHQITYRRGTVTSARFRPDGESVLYTANWGATSRKLYTTDLMSPESRELGFNSQSLAAVSPHGELALLSNDSASGGAMLLRVHENGGAPLGVARHVIAADWMPDDNLALVREDDQGWVVEFPRGKVVYRSPGWMTHLRVSPRGDRVAVLEHAMFTDDAGAVRVIERNGETRVLSSGWSSAWGLAWNPSGSEIWFTAATSGLNRSLHAVNLTGKVRDIEATPGMMTLEDISRSGRVLISHGQTRMMMMQSDAHGNEHDLSWFDLTRAQGMSDGGKLILFDESGEGGGPGYSSYLYRAESGGVVRLGEGRAMALDHDGAFALTQAQSDLTALRIIPLEPGPTRTIAAPGIQYIWTEVFPGGRRILFGGKPKDSKPRLYLQDIDGTNLHALEPPIWLTSVAISNDGAEIAGLDTSKNIVIVGAKGGKPKQVPLALHAAPLRWSGDDKSLFVMSIEIPSKILKVDVNTGASSEVMVVAPSDAAGVTNIFNVLLSADAKSVVYSYERVLSELYVVNGWK